MRSVVILLVLLTALINQGCSTGNKPKVDQGLVHYRLGVSYLNEGDATGALKELLIAETYSSKDPQIQNALGLAYYKKDELNLAQQSFQKAIKLNPKFSDARNNLGIIYMEKKMWDNAIEEFTIAVNDLLYATPEFAYTNMGWTYFKKGDPVKARESYQKAIERNPKFPKAHHDLGLLMFSLNKTEDAISHYKTAIKLFPNYLDAHFNLGLAYLKLTRSKEAEDAFREVVKIDPDSEHGKNAQKYLDLLRK